MGEEKSYKLAITRPAMIRYQERVLFYLYKNFSFDRATEIDENIIKTAGTLVSKPARGRREIHLSSFKENFRFILHKETKNFEIKIIYHINEEKSTVYITDFFPTKMNPERIAQ
jgi:hypothetical protein